MDISKFKSLPLQSVRSVEPKMALTIGKRPLVCFNAAVKRFLKQFEPCVDVQLNEDENCILVKASKIGLNCKTTLSVHNNYLTTYLLDKYEPTETVHFDGEFLEKEHAVLFRLP